MDRRRVLRAAAATSLALALPRASAQSTRTPVKIALNRAPYDASNAPFLLEKITKKAGRQLVCSKDDCSFVKDAPLAEPIPA